MVGGSGAAGAQWRYQHRCRTRPPIGGLACFLFGPAQEIYNEELRDLLGKGPPKDKKHAVGAQ